jgi:S1-C subfamily serine protease
MSLLYPLLLFSLTPNPAAPPPALGGTALVWAKTDALTAQGTGVLVDKQQRLVVTAYHVVGAGKELWVLFPLYDGRRLLTVPLPYQERCKHGEAIRARVVVADPRRDLAVLQLDSVPEDVREVVAATVAPRANDGIYFIGNPQAKNVLWDRAGGTAAGVRKCSWVFPSGQEVSVDVLEVETGAGLEAGFSGGPALNAAGELVGVTLAAAEVQSPRIYCAAAVAVRRPLAESYSTLAQTAILRGDNKAARVLLAKARQLAPADARTAWLQTVLDLLHGISTRGVHP